VRPRLSVSTTHLYAGADDGLTAPLAAK